ncbi:GNAT family N-acetyltransferase [Undibacterium rugosum]|nr:GNAT family protein [Undibacterium rugosum]
MHDMSSHDFSQVRLSTARLELRPMQMADTDALFAMCADAEFVRYWSEPAWQHTEQAERRIQRDLDALPRGEYLNLSLVRKQDGVWLGNCCLFSFLWKCRRAEIGYGLARPYWGQGYMQEALRALLAYGFEHLQLHRVEADIDPANHASELSLKRLGFVQEGLLRERWIVDGQVSDSALFGLLQADWLALQTSAARHASV